MEKYLLLFILLILGTAVLAAGEPVKESVKENRDIIKRYIILSENFEKKAVSAEKRKDAGLASAYRKCAKTKRTLSKAMLSGKKVSLLNKEIKDDEKASLALDNLLKERSLKEIPKKKNLCPSADGCLGGAFSKE